MSASFLLQLTMPGRNCSSNCLPFQLSMTTATFKVYYIGCKHTLNALKKLNLFSEKFLNLYYRPLDLSRKYIAYLKDPIYNNNVPGHS